MDQASDAASDHSLNEARTGLPVEITSFVGRTIELDGIQDLLDETRLLTLAGMGGCGKSRLALQSAARSLERFPDGIWWVEIAALEDAELLTPEVAAVLGLRERPGQAPIDTLRMHLAERRALLVLDNCEHLLEACAALVEALLSRCQSLAVLTTSREALGLPDELTFRVPPLSLPADSASVNTLERSDAARLFVERAAHARPSFAVTQDNVPAIAAICRKLDGMPLAIELAAARVRMLSPERIARELDDRFRLLTGGARTLVPRHETLRASIDWSHELCSDEERVLLRRLSVWAGGFTLDGAQSVSADEQLHRVAVLEPLTGLVDKSLVVTEERRGEIRFRMLETIRQYAAQRLAEAGEADATHARHLAWCLQLAERAEPELVRHDARVWLSRLELEAPNLRAALEWGMATNGAAATQLAAALTLFWLMRGQLEEGTAALARVLDVAPRPSVAHAKALWGLTELWQWSGHFEAALGCAGPALAAGEAVDDRSVMARVLKVQGLIGNLVDHLKRAPLERSIALAHEAADDWCRAESTRFLGASYVRQSEHESARPILDEAYALALELGHRPLFAWYFNLRAWGELEHGRVPAARELAEQAIKASNEIRDPITFGMATAFLVECDVLEGLPEQGRARAEPCLELMRRRGHRAAHVWLENAISLVDVAQDCVDAAHRRIMSTLGLIETMPAYDVVSKARRRLAVVLLLSGDLDGAESEGQLVLSHARTGHNEHLEAIARYLLGRVALARGAVFEAEVHLHEALAIAARRDFRPQTLNSLESLAYVAALTDNAAQAARLLGAVQSAREQLGLVRWPPELELWANVADAVRSELGEDACRAANAEGLALRLEEAVEYAMRGRGTRKRPAHGWESLTPTEREVVRYAAAGLTNPQIGERMFISRGTAKVHLSHIFAKLDVSSRSELAAEATRRGLDIPNAAGSTPP